jgi:hypothetical protein
MLDRSGKLWRGEGYEDLAEYVREFQAGGFPVARVIESVCGRCDSRTFHVAVDAAEERARRTCVRCETVAYVGDSEGRWEDTGTVECECPCGSREFAMAVGFALRDPGEVRWISVGLWCMTDNAVAIYADWGVDFTPSQDLLRRV